MVSHVVLILSETNPIICAVSEPNTENQVRLGMGAVGKWASFSAPPGS